MARANKQLTCIRAALEGIAAEEAVMTDTLPLVRLRIEQALQRTGLTSLLDPAIDELDQIGQAIETTKVQVGAALSALTERE